jgi:DNA-binding SARP family transcriptional activator
VLRRARSGDQPLLSRQGDLVDLAANVWVDADAFHDDAERVLSRRGPPPALAEVVEVAHRYGGDLLPSDPYADWAVARREHLRRRYLAVTDLGVRLAAEAADIDVAIELLERAIGYDAEDLHRHDELVRLLEAAGRGSAARVVARRADQLRRVLEGR